MKTVNIILDTLLGDMLHSFTISRYLYLKDGTKTNFLHLYAPDHTYHLPFEQIHDELKRVLTYQDFTNSFKLFDPSVDNWDFNIHNWVYGPYVYKDAFPDVMLKTFIGEDYELPKNFKVLDMPINPQYPEALIINRKIEGRPELSPFAENIYRNIIDSFEEKYFIFNLEKQYDDFKLKDLVKPLYVPDLFDMMSIIQSCKLFVGNQSAPLAMASVMNVNRVGELFNQSSVDQYHYILDAHRYDNAEFFDYISYITDKKIYLK
jgi:hypothetical protein